MIFAIILPIPYIIHVNLGNAGIVTYNKDIDLKMLPPKIQQICRLRGITTPTLLMVRHVAPNWITLVIATEQYPTGVAVEMSEHIIEWYVDWRDFDLANQAFQKLAISKVERLKEHEAFIEQLLYATKGPISLHSISKAAFYGGPVLFILCLTLIVQKRLAVWNLTALISAYSFQIWCLNTLASTHHIAVNTEWEYFGYMFFVMIPLSLYAWYFERSEGGHTLARKMWALSRLLGIMRE